jgi:hypothetical protein
VHNQLWLELFPVARRFSSCRRKVAPGAAMKKSALCERLREFETEGEVLTPLQCCT